MSYLRSFRRRTCTVVPTLFAMLATVATVGTGFAADSSAPAVELRVTDGQAMVVQWAITPIGRTWADPVAKPLHEPFDAWQQEVAKTLGGTPVELLEATSKGSLQARAGVTPDKPEVAGGIDVGRFAEKLFALMADNPQAKAANVPGAAGAVAFGEGGLQMVMARLGTALAMGWNTPPAAPKAPAEPLKDMAVAHADIPKLFDLIEGYMKSMPDQNPEMMKQLVDMRTQFAAQGFTSITYRMQFQKEGVLERITGPIGTIQGYKPVDRSLLARLPTTASMVVAAGYDLEEVWNTQKEQMLSSWAPLVGTDPKDPLATERAIDERIGAFIPGVTLGEAVKGFKGTGIFALSQGVPFPTVTMVLPRSKAIDAAIAQGLTMLGQQPPAEGAASLIPIPNAPVALTLVCEKTTWMATTDTTFGDAWLTGKANGWADTPAAKLAYERAPKDAYMIGATDTPAVIKTITGYVGMGLGMAQDMKAEQKQAILGSLNKLAENAAMDYLVAGTTDGGKQMLTEMRTVSGLMPLFLGAGIAAPVMANRRAAGMAGRQPRAQRTGPVTMLRETIFPAEVQFQAGAYIDQDGDGTGEYGLLSEISGRRATGSGSAELIEGPLARGASAGGYSYTVYLPGGKDRVSDDGKKEPRATVAADAELQEQNFVAYAWPTREKDGTMYALLPDGTVHQAPYAGVSPVWNAVFGGKSWTDAPTWEAVADDETGAPIGGDATVKPAPVDVP